MDYILQPVQYLTSMTDTCGTSVRNVFFEVIELKTEEIFGEISFQMELRQD